MSAPVEVAPPRTLVIGTKTFAQHSDTDSFFTKVNFSDYELLIVDPIGALAGLGDVSKATATGSLSLKADLARELRVRFMETCVRIAKFVSRGGFVIFFLRSLPHVFYLDEQRKTRSFALTEHFSYGTLSLIGA